MRCLLWASFGLLPFSIFQAHGAESGRALPKGNSDVLEKGVEGPDQKASEGAKAERGLACSVDAAIPPGGNGLFSKDGAYLYLLSPGDTSKTANAASDSAKAKLTLFKINLKEHRAEPLLSLEQGGDPSLITHGDPPDGVSAVAFSSKTSACNEGQALVISVTFAKNNGLQSKAVQKSGTYQLVETSLGRSLVDLKKGAILETDGKTFQNKVARKLPKNSRPLYFDADKRSIIAWQKASSGKGLVELTLEGVGKRLALKDGDRLLQDGGRFGAAHATLKTNAFEIQEIQGWSGGSQAARFKVILPKNFSVATVASRIHFAKKLVAFFAGPGAQVQGGPEKVLFYEYMSGKDLGQISLAQKQAVNFVGFDPTGTYAVVESVGKLTRRGAQIKILELSTGIVNEVKMTL